MRRKPPTRGCWRSRARSRRYCQQRHRHAERARREHCPTEEREAMTQEFIAARRRVLSASVGSAVLGVGLPSLAQAKELKVGFFIALSGPAALFGPTQRACADLAAEKIN